MSDMHAFEAAASVTAAVSPHDIWAIWVDVNGWKNWNQGVETADIRDNFKLGNSFTLTPCGGRAVQVKITTVTQGEEFSDEAELPFGTIRNFHRMERLGSRIKLTHELRAEIKPEMVDIFEKQIWPRMQVDLPISLNNIVGIVQAD